MAELAFEIEQRGFAELIYFAQIWLQEDAAVLVQHALGVASCGFLFVAPEALGEL